MHTLITTGLLVGAAVLWGIAMVMVTLKLIDWHTARSKSWNEV